MRRVLVLAAALTLAASAAQARGDDARAALKAGGCDGEIAKADLGPWAGGPGDLAVVAGVSPQEDGDSIGDLCVALVRRTGATFTPIARTPEEPAIAPPAEVSPTSGVFVTVQRTPFCFSPSETAVAVSAGGDFESTSTEADWEQLYLFRVHGTKLVPIFDAQLHYGETEKPAGVRDRWTQRVVRFDTRTTRGVYDLILARKGRRTGQRYVWNGARYVAARGG